MKSIIKLSLLAFGLIATPTYDVQAETNTKQVSHQTIDQLLQYATSLKETPFIYGGTTKTGFDSSGFVQFVYRHFRVNLPRTTQEMAQVGTTTQRKDLKSGDLVFFDTIPNKQKDIGFVGIYIGKDQFIGATVSKGVSIHSLQNSYWKTKYVKATRVVKKETNSNQLITLDSATIQGFKEGKIKGLPFSFAALLTMSMVEKAWGKPDKIYDYEDMHSYVYHQNGKQVLFMEDELRNITYIKAEIDTTRDEITKKMAIKPSISTKKILVYDLGNYRIQFEKSLPDQWWIIFYVKQQA